MTNKINDHYQCMRCGEPVEAILCENCIREQLQACQEKIAIQSKLREQANL